MSTLFNALNILSNFKHLPNASGFEPKTTIKVHTVLKYIIILYKVLSKNNHVKFKQLKRIYKVSRFKKLNLVLKICIKQTNNYIIWIFKIDYWKPIPKIIILLLYYFFNL